MADNCEPRKIDSGVAGLSYTETICGRLPTMEEDGIVPTWYEREPNSYSDFGGSITTTARRPLSASRQRKKGVVTDLNAGGGFNEDVTKSNFTRLMQGFLFADAHQKATTHPFNGEALDVTGATTATNVYDLGSPANQLPFRVGNLVLASGFTVAANNGLKRVTAVDGDSITVNEALVTEVTGFENAKIETVGWQFPSAAISLTVVGNIPSLNLVAAPVAATGTVLIADVIADDTVTIGGVEYTFVAGAPEAEGEVPIGADDDETAANLAAAINGAVLFTPAHPLVSATVSTATVTVAARIAGLGGNLITLDEAATDVTLSGAALSGGTGYSFFELGLVPGEWVYLGGDAAATRLGANAGYARVSLIAAQKLTFDKTTWAPVANDGTGVTVQLFVGTTVKNEKDQDLITTRYYEFERTLGKDADGVQAEYLTRSVLNEFTLNVPLPEGEEAKLNADLSFVAGDAEQRTGAEGLKPGNRVGAPGEDAINTASNIVRMRMSLLDPTNTRPTPLFAYLSEATLTVNNNVSPVKAIGTLGSIDVNVGDFDVGGDVTAIFSTVAATKAVRNNADVTLDFIAAAGNAGFVYDIPLLSLGDGAPDIEAGREIRVNLELMGAENPNGYTLLYTNWAYLPTYAMPKAGTAY